MEERFCILVCWPPVRCLRRAADRQVFAEPIWRCNNERVGRGVYLRLVICEDFIASASRWLPCVNGLRKPDAQRGDGVALNADILPAPQPWAERYGAGPLDPPN